MPCKAFSPTISACGQQSFHHNLAPRGKFLTVCGSHEKLTEPDLSMRLLTWLQRLVFKKASGSHLSEVVTV